MRRCRISLINYFLQTYHKKEVEKPDLVFGKNHQYNAHSMFVHLIIRLKNLVGVLIKNENLNIHIDSVTFTLIKKSHTPFGCAFVFID
jgi:hypothetical protein